MVDGTVYIGAMLNRSSAKGRRIGSSSRITSRIGSMCIALKAFLQSTLPTTREGSASKRLQIRWATISVVGNIRWALVFSRGRWMFTVEISADSRITKIGDTGAFGGAASFDEITVENMTANGFDDVISGRIPTTKVILSRTNQIVA
jgi:hypothetical protein